MSTTTSATATRACGIEGGNFFGYSLGHYYVFGDHRPGETDVWAEFEERRHIHGYDPAVALAVEQETLGAKISAGRQHRPPRRGRHPRPDP